MEKHYSKTITGRFVLITSLLLFGSIALTVLLNTFFLDDLYSLDKEAKLKEMFTWIDLASANDRLQTDGFRLTLENMTDRDNVDVVLLTSDGTVLLSTASNYEELREQFMTLILMQGDQGGVIEETEQYMLKKQTDTRLNSDYLVLWGTLSKGYFILLRSAMESMHETAILSNRFLLVTGFFSALVGILVMIFATGRMTRPIIRLSEISKRMAGLDFDAKYEGQSYREVDELGESMNRLSEKLERTISDLKSANNALKADNEKKTEIDEMRKEFLSNVSHELKTPLALIRGYAEGLTEGIADGDPETRDFYCEVITDEAEKMSRMVGKLLTLNQLEFGEEEIRMERFDAAEVIRAVLSASSLLFQQEGIDAAYVDEGPLIVWADEFLTEQVLTNFVSNALHHCSGEKKIRIRSERRESLIRISVFNTGNPIPEEELNKIWIKFYKVDKARTREYGGNGIGLSIVKACMDKMHQSCGVLNRPDGVEFWMELDGHTDMDEDW